MRNERSECIRILHELDKANSHRLTKKIVVHSPYFVTFVVVDVPGSGNNVGIPFDRSAVGVGVAKCSHSDPFDSSKGRRISLIRAFRAIADDHIARRAVLDYARKLGLVLRS